MRGLTFWGPSVLALQLAMLPAPRAEAAGPTYLPAIGCQGYAYGNSATSPITCSTTIPGSAFAPGAAASNLGSGFAANNTQLSALSSTFSPSVIRLGYAAAGDSPATPYTPSNSACSLNAGAGDGGSQIPSADGKCWLASFAGHAWASQFGASPSASAAANLTALTAWLNVASATLELDIASGVYNVSAGLTLPPVANESVIASGGNATFNYNGASTTANIFTAGSASGLTQGVRLDNLRTTSSTAMTGTAGIGGTGFYFQNLSESRLHNIYGGNSDLDSNRNLYNGIVFAGAHTVYLDGWTAYAQNDGLQVYATTYGNSDLWATQGNAYLCQNDGIHIAGGFGGFYLDTTNIFKSATNNILIDEQLSASSNTQIFVGPLVSNDGNYTTTNLVNINDTGTSVQNVNLAGYMGGFGSYAVNIQNWGTSGNYGRVNITGANILNNGTGTGLYVQDQYTNIAIDASTQFTNLGKGIDASVSTKLISSLAQYKFNTTDVTANTNLGYVPFTPTLGCFSGGGSVGTSTITASVNYSGYKTAVVNANIVLGTVTGTCSQLTISLPFTSATSQFAGSAFDATSFASEPALVQSAATQVIVFEAATTGHTIVLGPMTVPTQ